MSRPKGFKHSEETRRKMSESAMGNQRNLGRFPSDETREKIRQSKLGKARPDMIGHKWTAGNTWSRGKVLSDATKEKISKAKTGTRQTLEQRLKRAATAKRGEEHHNWKGGTGTLRHLEMGNLKYAIWRDAVFQKDNYTCQVCDQYSGYIHADHIKTWAEYPDLRYDVDNGRTLCRACHYYVTFKRKMPSTSKWGLTNVAKKEG